MPRVNLELPLRSIIHTSDIDPNQHHGAIVKYAGRTDGSSYMVLRLSSTRDYALLDLDTLQVHTAIMEGDLQIIAQDSEVTIKCV